MGELDWGEILHGVVFENPEYWRSLALSAGLLAASAVLVVLGVALAERWRRLEGVGLVLMGVGLLSAVPFLYWFLEHVLVWPALLVGFVFTSVVEPGGAMGAVLCTLLAQWVRWVWLSPYRR